MHVGEQSAYSLRRTLRLTGFASVRVRHGEMIYADFVPEPDARVTYIRLANHRLTRPLGRADLWGEATAP
jgi:hypothetical protein